MRQISFILGVFLITQLLGVYVGVSMIRLSVTVPEVQQLNVAPGGESSSPVSSAIFLLYVLAGAVLMVLVLRFYKGLFLFRMLEAVTLFIASNIVFYVVFLSLAVPWGWTLAVFLSAFITALKFMRPELKNLAAVLASAGVGAVFGFSLDIVPTLIFVAGLSLYDFLSVFVTGHMIYLARELGKKQLAFSIAATETQYVEETGKEESTTLELGTGDMIIPLMLAVSSYKLSLSVFDSLAVVAGALVGLALVLWFVTRKKTYLPALPPISFFALLFLALAKLLMG